MAHSYAGSEDKADVDLTPMLDVVFIMLIFFIVTASFVREDTLDLNLPESNKTQESRAAALLITVNVNDDILFDNRRVDARSVRSLLAQKIAEDPERAIVVRAHKQSSVASYIRIVDAANSLNNFAVSLLPYSE